MSQARNNRKKKSTGKREGKSVFKKSISPKATSKRPIAKQTIDGNETMRLNKYLSLIHI